MRSKYYFLASKQMTQQNCDSCPLLRQRKENCFWEFHLTLHNMGLLKTNSLSVLLMHVLLE